MSNTLAQAIVIGAAITAAAIDLRTRRVPNVLTMSVALVGLGLAAVGMGRVGIVASAVGCLIGLAMMLPGYLIGATGGGDVKLMAAIGTLLGPAATFRAFADYDAGGNRCLCDVGGIEHWRDSCAERQPVCVCAGDCDWCDRRVAHVEKAGNMRPHWMRLRRDQRGAALIEMAFALPLLLLISIGILEFGRAFQTWQILTNAAREGARVAVLPGIDDSMVTARVQEYVQAGVLDPNVTTQVTIQRSVSISYGSGTASGSKVTVSYPFKFMVLNGVAKLVASNTTLGSDFTMAASATMRNEN